MDSWSNGANAAAAAAAAVVLSSSNSNNTAAAAAAAPLLQGYLYQCYRRSALAAAAAAAATQSSSLLLSTSTTAPLSPRVATTHSDSIRFHSPLASALTGSGRCNSGEITDKVCFHRPASPVARTKTNSYQKFLKNLQPSSAPESEPSSGNGSNPTHSDSEDNLILDVTGAHSPTGSTSSSNGPITSQTSENSVTVNGQMPAQRSK